MHRRLLCQFRQHLLYEITSLIFKCPISLGSLAQQILKDSPHVPLRMSGRCLAHWIIISPHCACVCRKTKNNWITPEAQLKLRVKFCLGDKFKEGIIDQLHSCASLSVSEKKNPAYGRHWLSQCGRIIALCQKNKQNISVRFGTTPRF